MPTEADNVHTYTAQWNVGNSRSIILNQSSYLNRLPSAKAAKQQKISHIYFH